MKFTLEQIKEFRDMLGITTAGADEAMQHVCKLVSDYVATKYSDEDLVDGEPGARALAQLRDDLEAMQ